MTTTTERVTYRQVLAVREFRALFVAELLSVGGDQVARIAVALLVFMRTGSSFLASATYACSYLSWLLGGPVLSAISDRRSRRSVMLTCDAARAGLVVLLVVPHLPTGAVFVVLLAVALLAPPFESARSAVIPDVLGDDAYTTGNALQNSALTIGQVAGFAVGGGLVAALGVRGALAVDALSFLLSAALILRWVRPRPRPVTATTASLTADTATGVRLVLAQPVLRWLLAVACVGMAVTVPTEGLAVPTAAALHRGAVTAGFLSAAVPAGYVIGAFLITRILSADRRRRLQPLLVLSALPLLASPLVDEPVVLMGVWVVAGVGSALQVIANAEYVLATPTEFRGRAFGVAATALMVTQGLILMVVGAVADSFDPRWAIAGAGAAGLLLMPAVAHFSPEEVRKAQGRHTLRRGQPG